MQKRICALALAAMVAALAGGCDGDGTEVEEESPADTTPTLVVDNLHIETVVLQITYDTGARSILREFELRPGGTFIKDYPELGTLSVVIGRLRDGWELLRETFVRADFREDGATLTIVLRP